MRRYSILSIKLRQIMSIITVTAFAAICVAIVCPAAAAAAAAPVARATDNVRLRVEPSASSTALALVVEGSDVSVLGESGNWTKVGCEGMVGYIRSDYLVKLLGETDGAGGSLKNGSEGDAVKDLQKLLASVGFFEGPVNGKFGPLTEAAVIKFQESNGLEADGIVGAATKKRLNEKAAAPKASEQKAAAPKSADQKAAAPKSADQKAAAPKAADASAQAGARVPGTFRRDDEGDGVTGIQKLLTSKGYYSGPINGKFGPLTEKAVTRFQEANDLEADGIVGKETLAALDGSGSAASSAGKASDAAAAAPPKSNAKSNAKSSHGVELLDWSEAIKYMVVGAVASIYDIRTGITYNVRSFSNGLHADVEPVTREDTALLKKTYGGVWSWDPRPVWVSVSGHVMVASINGMPHGGGVNDSNGMDGQVCLHFRGGSTHNSNKAYAQLHQEAIIEAWEAAQKQ